MTNFVLVRDPDHDRRNGFLARVAREVAFAPGMVTGRMDGAGAGVVWAAIPSAPVRTATADDGFALVLGDALTREHARPVEAIDLWRRWCSAGAGNRPGHDGFHCAVVHDQRAGTLAAADLLGAFPVYHHHAGDVLLVGSSPELFRHHPAFRPAVDPRGVVATLLTSGLVGGRTLWSGVRRLPPERMVLARPGAGPEEVLHDPLADRTEVERLDVGGSFGDQVAVLTEAVRAAVARQAPAGERHGLLLSGGLDSRMLAGVLHDQGSDVLAVTLGRPSDHEVRCARRVVAAIGAEHLVAETPPDEQLEALERHVRWEHLASGLSGGATVVPSTVVRDLPARLVTGYGIDALLDKSHFVRSPPPDFAWAFARQNATMLPPGAVRELLGPGEWVAAVDEVLEDLRDGYAAGTDSPLGPARLHHLLHRQRFHVCSSAWRHAASVWPVVPILDRQLLTVAAALPVDAVERRRAQEQLMVAAFPDLSALPLDHDGRHSAPLRARGWRAAVPLARIQQALRAVERRTPLPTRHRFDRVLSPDSAAWSELRRRAEPGRSRIEAFLRSDALARLVPPPPTPIPPVPVEGRTTRQAVRPVVGFMRWSVDHDL